MHLAALEQIAVRYQATRAQIVLAWLLAQSPALIAISGATREQTIRGSATSSRLRLTEQDTALLDRAIASGACPGKAAGDPSDPVA